MKLSIVIPVYNGAKYLEPLFHCLAEQTSQAYEAVFINDGSKDQTEETFRTLCERYPQVNAVLYSQENQGVSAARNYGIKQAAGDMLTFCDVDDLIPPQYVDYILQAFEQTDAQLIFWAFLRCSDGKAPTTEVGPLTFQTVRQQTACEKFLYKELISGCWSCAVRMDIVRAHGILYDTQTHYGEDLNFVWKLLLSCRAVCCIKNILYYYIIQSGSAMSKFDERRLEGYRVAAALNEFAREQCPEFAPLYEEYEAARILWSIAWQAAVRLPSYETFKRYFEDVPIRQNMRALCDFPARSVRWTARLYLLSPALFYRLMRHAGKNKCS